MQLVIIDKLVNNNLYFLTAIESNAVGFLQRIQNEINNLTKYDINCVVVIDIDFDI